MALMTFAAKTKSASLTAEEIIAAMVDIVESIPSEPFALFMQEQGHDPKDGWTLVLPDSVKCLWDGGFLPSYVMFSRIIDAPFFIKQPKYFETEGFV